MIARFLWTCCALLLSTPVSLAQSEENFVFDGKPPQFEDFGYLLSSAVWPSAEDEPAIIFVCWENPDESNAEARGWVQEAVEQTWAAEAGMEFRGWRQCAEINRGVRILITDSGPMVKALGAGLDGLENGMHLNFTFENWGQGCQEFRKTCIRAIAVHEFGHALGFAHEQNRADVPGECAELGLEQGADGDTALTPYDPDSVMNYCSNMYATGGALSLLDIEAVRKVYGAPR